MGADGPLLLGIDNGLTATKAALFDTAGRTVGLAHLPTHLTTSGRGFSEIGMSQLWDTTCAAVRQVLATTGTPANRVVAVGLSGHGNGLYRLDRAQRPIEPAFSSMDHRALAFTAALDPETEQALKHITLQKVWSGQPGSLLRWLRDHHPEDYHETGTAFLCKDWIRYCLTGELATDLTDVSAAGLFDNRNRRYSAEALALLKIPEAEAWLPPAFRSTDSVGRIRPDAAAATGLAAGTPVVGGLFDVAANPLGSGLVAEGQFCMVAGTWSINLALSRTPREPLAVRQCTLYGDDLHYSFIDSSATSASNLTWFLDKVLGGQCSYAEFGQAIERFAPHEVDSLFLPFVNGGLRDDDPGAMFLGLRAAQGRDELLRAIAEGIGLAHRYHIHNLRQEGLTGQHVLFTGGASRNEPWCRLMADILQLPLVVPACVETGALGASVVAAVGSGLFASVSAAVTEMVHVRSRYQPDANHSATYQDKFERFCAAISRLSP